MITKEINYDRLDSHRHPAIPGQALRMKSKLSRSQVVILATIILVGLGAIQLGIATLGGKSPAWDKKVMHNVRDYAERMGAPIVTHVNEAIRDISALGSMIVLGILSVIVSGYFLIRRDYTACIVLLGSWLGGWTVMNGLKYCYGRARPDIVQNLQEATGYSFPSGHTMVSTIVYLTLAILLADRTERRSGRIYVITFASTLTLLIGFSRVYIGVHYPTDVLGGWGFGLIFVLVVRLMMEWKSPKKSRNLSENAQKTGASSLNS